MENDDIVVGAGSSGAVIAARLSEQAGRRVLLLEAGPHYPSLEATPADLRNGYAMSLVDHDWGYQALADAERSIPLPRGKVTGGSSAVNAGVAPRGMPADYDEWASLGNPAWDWDQVLSYFRRLEDDPEGDDRLHGRGGPIRVRRPPPEEWTPVQAAFVATCCDLGFPFVQDHNDPATTGVGPWPVNVRDGVRISTALAYLHPAQGRANLTILPRALVRRVLFDGERAVGVEVEQDSGVATVYGERVTLCAGAIGTPSILQRSGVGDAARLRTLGVPVVADLPGVGANLMDHPLALVALLPRGDLLDRAQPTMQALLRTTAPGSEEADDLHLFPYGFLPLGDPAGTVVFAISVGLMRPHSRGRVDITTHDPHAPPAIALNFLSDPEDRRRMREGLRLALRITAEPAMTRHVERVLGLDETLAASDEALDAHLLSSVRSYQHAAGTARMGPVGDLGAVVSQWGQVRDLDALWVADASIMPAIPRANTNLTCIMIGERIADRLLGQGCV